MKWLHDLKAINPQYARNQSSFTLRNLQRRLPAQENIVYRALLTD